MTTRRWRRGALVAFAVYLGVVGYGTFGPSPGEEIYAVADGVKRAGSQVGSAVQPGSTRVAADDPAPRSDGDWFEGADSEEVANLVMFVPLGLLLPVLWPRRHEWTVPLGVALSGAIELTQLVVVTHRSPEWNDLFWNGMGALLGYAVWLSASAGLRRLRAR